MSNNTEKQFVGEQVQQLREQATRFEIGAEAVAHQLGMMKGSYGELVADALRASLETSPFRSENAFTLGVREFFRNLDKPTSPSKSNKVSESNGI